MIRAIRKSWKAVRKQMSSVGARMFLRLFSRSEYLKAYFAHLAERDAAVFKGKEIQALEMHGMAVLGVVDKVIKHLDDLSKTFELLRKVGRMHTKLPEYNRFVFWFIEEPFMYVMNLTIGNEKFTADLHEAYRWLICWVITRLGEEFRFAQEAAEAEEEEATNTAA